MGYTFCVFGYNEEKHIVNSVEACRNAMTSLDLNSEIIVIDDGSTDYTFSILIRKYGKANERVKIIRHRVNSGPTKSMLTASKLAKYSKFVLVPGDHTYDYAAIRDMIVFDQKCNLPNGVTIGVRHPNRKKRGVLRELSSRLAVISLKWISPFASTLPDIGFIIAPTKIVKIIPSQVRPYGQAIGLLGVSLLVKATFSFTTINQVPGSELRTGKLNYSKIFDVVMTHFVLLKNIIRIKRLSRA
jgi:glycosyltransferase involved in cell wall biosynthesis